MYYRVAIQRQGDQLDRPPSWQWQSTVLSSLQTLFQFLRLYSALPQDHLRVFSSSSRESLDEQLARENQGLESSSVTAARFLQERRISSRENERTSSLTVATELATPLTRLPSTWPAPNDGSRRAHTRDERDMNALYRRRLELERGAGGDHDVPYRFALPLSMPQVLAWMRLMGRVQRGEL